MVNVYTVDTDGKVWAVRKLTKLAAVRLYNKLNREATPEIKEIGWALDSHTPTFVLEALKG
ncbi:hypothetical protein SEA_STROSAHL_100 [Gordonia phage Strosahl]|uniref:Uncharacterized protein n=2 Tax=Soupsvirus strosahl TaxID=2560510 RepID=A0A1B3B1A4_9CAUD|nr:hypothetical protein BIZ67_gp010 [Gordonia phage Remus]YP_009596301.1 hypothetical protein FDH03_gp010 [Gordonia phage Strosahl]AOE44703.1 hypothetical protein SEA_REMUS_100 [Gordonia phage Remus]AOE44810.1 hypothetical protein SEA_STROSAHL_100 [Gordonia phage Strosahl]